VEDVPVILQEGNLPHQYCALFVCDFDGFGVLFIALPFHHLCNFTLEEKNMKRIKDETKKIFFNILLLNEKYIHDNLLFFSNSHQSYFGKIKRKQKKKITIMKELQIYIAS